MSLVFDASNEPDYRGPGFRSQTSVRVQPSLTGSALYPAVTSFPVGSASKEVMPSIIMMITKFQRQLDTFEDVVFFYDMRVIFYELITIK